MDWLSRCSARGGIPGPWRLLPVDGCQCTIKAWDSQQLSFWNGHYGRPEVMAWCEANGVDYVLVLPTNAVLRADPEIVKVADACAVKRAEDQRPVLRNYAETRYAAKSWTCPRRVAARIEASTMGMDIRYVVTSFTEGSAEHIYDTLYCALLRPRSDLLRLSPRGRAAERPSPCLQPHKPTEPSRCKKRSGNARPVQVANAAKPQSTRTTPPS